MVDEVDGRVVNNAIFATARQRERMQCDEDLRRRNWGFKGRDKIEVVMARD